MRALSHLQKTIFASLLASAIAFAQPAQATTIDYEFEGAFAAFFDSTTNPALNFSIQFNYDDLSGLLDTDTRVFQLSGDLDGVVKNAQGGNIGTVNLDVDLQYTNVHPGQLGFDVIGRQDSNGSGRFAINAQLDNTAAGLGFDVNAKYANFTSQHDANSRDIFHELVDTGPFNLIVGYMQHYNRDTFKTWVMSANAVNIFGHEYIMYGDFHGFVAQRNTEIPEPATVALLGMGLLGGAMRRKKAEKA